MTQWMLINQTSWTPLNERLYPNETSAMQNLTRLGEAFARMYRPIPWFTNPRWYKVLREGFKPGDLENILLPQFSVDVYVPGDPDTDNVVVGFLIKGVPEAVFPFKQFLSFCAGVKHVDYGDSDTLPHTSLVYVEFDRERFHPNDLDELVQQVCLISGFTPEDFAVSFPNTNKTYPYSKERIATYFDYRSRHKNQMAQDRAIHDRTRELQKELEHEMQHGNIAKMLGAPAAQAAPPPAAAPSSKTDATLAKLQNLATGTLGAGGKKKDNKRVEVSDAVENMIINDAKRNLAQHSEYWEDFDKRWASRLRLSPSRVSSIRKKVYDLK